MPLLDMVRPVGLQACVNVKYSAVRVAEYKCHSKLVESKQYCSKLCVKDLSQKCWSCVLKSRAGQMNAMIMATTEMRSRKILYEDPK